LYTVPSLYAILFFPFKNIIVYIFILYHIFIKYTYNINILNIIL
jgi:hypothetical protein